MRNVFVAKVQCAAFSGLTSFVWNEGDSQPIDKCTCSLLRRMSKGIAMQKESDLSVSCSLSDREIMSRWQVVPRFVEFVVQRVKMYQSWCSYTYAFLLPVSALFGDWFCDELSEFDGNGRLKDFESSNPWLQQFHRDIQMLSMVENGQCFLENLDSRYKCLFQDVAIAEEFCLLNVSQLRYSTFAIALGPLRIMFWGKKRRACTSRKVLWKRRSRVNAWDMISLRVK